MTDVADRRWGQSLVRAPMARDAAPTPRRRPAPARATATDSPDATPVDPWDAVAADTALPWAPTPGPTMRAPAEASPPARTSGNRRPAATSALRPAATPAPALVPLALESPAALASSVPPPPAPAPRPGTNADAGVVGDGDPSLARLARGVQDCARALGCLADRLDRLERRIEAAPVAPPLPERAERTVPAVTAQHLDGFDQRLRRLETLPASVGRLQKDTAWLVDLATTRRIEAAATSRATAADELAPVYKELDSVAEAVSSHHAAATQSLERVRTLERAVLEMRRHVERSLAENTRGNASGQSSVDVRIEALEARLAEIESSAALTR